MDIFVFEPVSNAIDLHGGKTINNIKTTTWIERYRDAGEFTITATLASNIRDALPIGAMISHVASQEVMIVENHEVNEERGQDVEITVTGRSFESFLENRVVGANITFPNTFLPDEQKDYILPANKTWTQAITLLNDHIGPGRINPGDSLGNLIIRDIITYSTGPGSDPVERSLSIGNLYDALLDLLVVDDLGVRNIRQYGYAQTGLYLEVYDGRDISSNVMFSFDAGDITNADYLWTDKNEKNALMLVSKWYQLYLDVGNVSGYSKKVGVLDASDIDEGWSDPPSDSEALILKSAINARGLQYLAAKKKISLAKAQAAKNSKRFHYRRDFNVGDIVLIDGSFNQSEKMRVIEHVEVFGEDGFNSYPTLSTLIEET